MRTAQSFRLTLLSVLFALLLPACATATRGSTTLFIVETTPVGAKATTTVPTKEFGKMTQAKLDRINSGKLEEPEFEYRFCEPTPCGIELPRRTEFHVLVTKEGFRPEVHKIGYMHRKEIKKETARNTAIATGVAGAAGAATVASVTASLGSIGATAGGAGVAAGAAVFAAPVVLIGGVSMGVDAASGANYDVWPNPLPLTLIEIDNAEPEWSDIEAVKADFAKMQRRNAMTVPRSPSEVRAERKRLERERRKNLDKLEGVESDKSHDNETAS